MTRRRTRAGVERWSRAARVVGAAVVVLAFVGIVAIAATGSTRGGAGSSSRPADVLLDTVFSLVALLLLAGAVMIGYAILQWRELSWTAPRRHRWRGLVAFLAMAFALVLYVHLGGWSVLVDQQQSAPLDRGEPEAPPSRPDAGTETGYEFEVAWIPVVVVLALGLIGLAAVVVSARRKRPPRPDHALADALVAALDDTLDDLRAEADPRRAVVAAYARFERVVAAHGLPRRPSDTPEEHMARILLHLDVDRRVVRRLTDLFERAEFSPHAVDSGMKEEAIGALEQVRDQLSVEPSPGPSRPLREVPT